LYLIADEVYREFCYDGQTHYSVFNLTGIEDYVRVIDEGDTEFLSGDIIAYSIIRKANHDLKEKGLRTAKFIREFLGVTQAAIKTQSFLSAASFQEQVRVLSEAALIGKIDDLKGLKENVIIGRPVPLGTKNVEME